MSLSFLNHKSWHVTTVANQKRLFEAEEKERNRQKEAVRRAAILRKEKQLSDPALTSILRNGGVTGEARSVSFMYEPPPGYVPPEPTSETGAAELAMIQARAAAMSSLEDEVEQSEEIKNQGPRKHQHPFPKELEAQMEEEKRKAAEKKALAQNDLPKNSNKPLGMILRDVKCLRCGKMGHKSGDRECPMYDANPNDITRRRREDPLTRIQASQGLDANSKLKLIYTEDPVVGGVPTQSELNKFITDPELERQRQLQHREIIALGSSSESSSSDSSSDDDDSVELTATENAFLESLTAEEMMILLKRYKREKRLATKQRWREKMRELKLKRMVKIEGQERNEEEEQAHAEYKEERKKQRKKRKAKKRKKQSDSESESESSTSSSNSDSSSSDTDSRHRRRKHKHQKSDHSSVTTIAPTSSSSSGHPTTSSSSHSATSSSTSTSSTTSSATPRRRPRLVPVKSVTIDLTDDIDDDPAPVRVKPEASST